MTADSDNASDVLFGNWTTLAAEHLGHDVGSNMILVLFTEDDIAEATD